MTLSALYGIRRRQWMHRLGRILTVVIQLAFVLVPLSEGREERVLGAHVEAPTTAPHPGHRPDSCPACQMLSVHGLTQQRSELPDFPSVRNECGAQWTPAYAAVRLSRTNCSRAPPIDL